MMSADQQPAEPAPHGQIYLRAAYDNRDRFAAYWTQINEALSLEPRSALEIGVGSQMVIDYLRRRGIRTVGLDLRPDTMPDVAGAAGQLPFCAQAFDLVMACQVLEHLPFEQLAPVLADMARVSRRYIIISVPNAGRFLSLSLRASAVRSRRWFVELSGLLPRGEFRPSAHHYWELGWRDYPLERVTGMMHMADLRILRHYRVVERPYQHFFILEKRG
jgi:hypothetical protein